MKALKLNVLKLRHLNQDAIENLFCLIRQCGGSSSDLTCGQFTSALKTCLISRFSTLVRDKNCLDDNSFFMSDLREFLTEAATESVSSSNPPSSTPTVLRGDTPVSRRQVVVDDTLQRQGPTLLWASSVATISQQVKCCDCLKKLTTTEKTIDSMLSVMTSSYDIFPSKQLISVFLHILSKFELAWKRLLHRPKISEQTDQTPSGSDTHTGQ